MWHRDFLPGEFTERYYGDGDQGWFDPATSEVIEHDHTGIWQYNFTDILDPFYQEEGNIYWLEISVKLPLGATQQIGWKTSKSQHFEDDAVWGEVGPVDPGWQELYNPLPPNESLDLAFVITPEPVALMLLGFGAMVLLRRRR